MKRVVILVLTTLIISVSLSSCNKDKDDNDDPSEILGNWEITSLSIIMLIKTQACLVDFIIGKVISRSPLVMILIYQTMWKNVAEVVITNIRMG